MRVGSVGMFLACPRELGEKGEKGYRLMAMTRMFKHPGCITLDWLVQTDIKEGKSDDGGESQTRNDQGLIVGGIRQTE